MRDDCNLMVKLCFILFQVGITISHALWSCASTFSVFVLARFIGGLSKANVSLSMAIVTDASNEKTRARGMVRTRNYLLTII